MDCCEYFNNSVSKKVQYCIKLNFVLFYKVKCYNKIIFPFLEINSIN